MEIEKMSIADLKAAYDFVLLDLSELEEMAKKKSISTEDIPAYIEVKEIESKLWDELLNRTRFLQ